ncbi:helix-turn-helix domain-containing protein [Saccharopolyspora hattusasensis]|uniref:helix-turn-helix domain-containing protein n=1 Tax=Saccharopolyspora hattusasensis TaxID=1128679 RepID=UPI003D986CC6
MPSSSPTSLAVSDAITHYRQMRELTRDELAYVLEAAGHPLPADAITQMESRELDVTVDDLMALAYVLGTTPTALLTHIPIDMPCAEGPLATALPADVGQDELCAWVEGRTELDHQSRVQWCEDRVSRIRVLSTHHEEQLQGAYAEIRELGELADREADSAPVQALHTRIRDGEYALNQVDLALALAEQQLDDLRENTR